MIPSPNDCSIELHVPYAETEQEFLRLAVQAAVKSYRERHKCTQSSPAIDQEERVMTQGA